MQPDVAMFLPTAAEIKGISSSRRGLLYVSKHNRVAMLNNSYFLVVKLFT